MKKSNTNPDNTPNQTPNRRQSQTKKPTAKKPDDRTDEAGYQKLPHGLRPFGGCAQRDPLDYDSHPYGGQEGYEAQVSRRPSLRACSTMGAVEVSATLRLRGTLYC